MAAAPRHGRGWNSTAYGAIASSAPGARRALGPLFIVLNEGSGRREPGDDEALEAALRASGRPHRIVRARSGETLARLAHEAVTHAVREDGIVVAAGGDGTLNAVAQAALIGARPLGVLPRGTFNYFARAHGLPDDPQEAVRVWLQGRVRPVQVAEVNGRAFLVNASFGLYPRVLAAREEDNAVLGRHRAVAWWAGLRTLWRDRRSFRLVIETDGHVQRVRTPTLFVANNALQLEQLGLDEAQALREGDGLSGRLAAVHVHPVGFGRLVWLGLRGAVGELGGAQEVRSHTFRHMTVMPAGRRPSLRMQVACDGELHWLNAPLQFSAAAQALQLVVPDSPGEAA